jgi:membrane-bound lytic murein transglycosylase B
MKSLSHSVAQRLIAVLVTCSCLTALASTQAPNISQPQPTIERQDVQEFIDSMVIKHHFDRATLTELFAKVHLKPRIINTIHHPKEKTPWYKYKNIFLTSARTDAGAKFWQAHAQTLARAERQYGVPAKIIVGILGVETFYGSRTGNHGALDALATLAFNYPERARFFTSELEALLLLSREQHFQAQSLKSSYAGALGFPQFMPSSYRDYAVDYSGDGVADLLYNADDAIGSIANYLSKKGTWRQGQPIAIMAKSSNAKTSENYKNKVLTVAQLTEQGISTVIPVDSSLKATAFDIQETKHTETWVGFHNFKAILRYNPRIKYAMAVYQLGEAVSQAYESQQHHESK